MKIRYLIIFWLIVSLQACSSPESGATGEVIPGIPVENTVTLVDLGATTCIPCKLMAPILEELKEEYKRKAEVIFIDVWDKSNKNKALAFKVMAIPTQIFFDKRGKEVYRHIGFMDKKSIVEQLETLLGQK
jgi:thioredoxin 1